MPSNHCGLERYTYPLKTFCEGIQAKSNTNSFSKALMYKNCDKETAMTALLERLRNVAVVKEATGQWRSTAAALAVWLGGLVAWAGKACHARATRAYLRLTIKDIRHVGSRDVRTRSDRSSS